MGLAFRNLLRGFLPILSLGIMIGCIDKDGTWTLRGTWKTQESQVYAVGKIVRAELLGPRKIFEAKIFKLLGSDRGHLLRITSQQSLHDLSLEFSGISKKPINLFLESKSGKKVSAVGLMGEQRIRLEFDNNSISLKTYDGNGNSTLSLFLHQEETPRAPLSPVINLDEALGFARFDDYKIDQSAERIFKAKADVQIARGNLLPRLSGQTVISQFLYSITGFGEVSMVQSLIPFIFPTNWFQWKASKSNLKAEKAAYQALQGQEMLSLEVIYYALNRDLGILRDTEQFQAFLIQMRGMLVEQSSFGWTDQNLNNFINQKINNYQIDFNILQSLIVEEMASFNQAMALSPLDGQNVGITELHEPGIAEMAILEPRNFADLAQSHSPEVLALQYTLEAGVNSYWGNVFSFFTAGDYISIDFGYKARLDRSMSNRKELEKRIKETRYAIETSCVLVSTHYNLAIKNQREYEENYRLDQEQLERISSPLGTGVNNVRELINARENILRSHIKILNNTYAYFVAKAGFERLIKIGSYKNLGAAFLAEYPIEDKSDAMNNIEIHTM